MVNPRLRRAGEAARLRQTGPKSGDLNALDPAVPFPFARVPAGPGLREPGSRALAAEVPLSLSYNGVAHVVMMLTPADLEDFVLGFSFSEGIIEAPAELLALDIRAEAGGLLAQAQIPPERFEAVLKGRRNLVGQAGCGICGLVELEQALRPLPPIAGEARVTPEALFRGADALRARQPLNAETGAVHAAAALAGDGTLRALREDVGRHNALDKLIGHAMRGHHPLADGFLIVTSRLSYELVQKAVRAGAPCLAAISAPTSLAVELAREAGLTLAALVRDDSLLVFNDPHGALGGTGVQPRPR